MAPDCRDLAKKALDTAKIMEWQFTTLKLIFKIIEQIRSRKIHDFLGEKTFDGIHEFVSQWVTVLITDVFHLFQ